VAHKGQVNAIKFGPQLSDGTWSLLSGSANGELCVWQSDSNGSSAGKWRLLSRIKAHGGAINTIATLPGWQLFVTGGSDSVIKIWKLPDGACDAALIHTIPLQPRYIPLSVAIGDFTVQGGRDSVFVAVGGTRNAIQTYTVSGVTSGKSVHSLQATLTGHESWITSLALKRIGEPENGQEDDTWLASASQDKSIRLWRISRIELDGHEGSLKDDELTLEQSLTAKVHTIKAESVTLSVVFDALLLGHEDWIYTASWSPKAGSRQLLTASADNSLIVWEPEPSSGIWLSSARLGEISATKGATSATGSTGGFWIGLWSQDATAIACLGKTGSWRLWQHDKIRCYWAQRSAITGHVKSVTDLSWTARGEYLLSTSSDQTTRLHAEWRSANPTSWHEFARPQIHGYDLNCVQSLSATRFVSGADEKLLRVFDQPKNVAHTLERLCKITSSDEIERMPESADMPVLGLSNKAIIHSAGDELNANVADGPGNAIATTSHELEEPPTEDHLARHTLWAEHEKLYGHGHEISALAANRSGSTIATACKASSTEHAVIRLYDTKDWHEIRPSLAAHSLTIARLQFHMSDDHLLSVGRDRQWALFAPAGLEDEADSNKLAAHNYSISAANPKGHTRMILDAAWSSASIVPLFATAGRDKTVKIWASADGNRHDFVCKTTITRSAPVTAIAICDSSEGSLACLAVGEETGKLSYHILSVETFRNGGSKHAEPHKSFEIEERLCPSKAVTRLAWRPAGSQQRDADGPDELAVASADSSLRILSIDWQDCKAMERNKIG
jgi:elongator complex protein 2